MRRLYESYIVEGEGYEKVTFTYKKPGHFVACRFVHPCTHRREAGRRHLRGSLRPLPRSARAASLIVLVGQQQR